MYLSRETTVEDGQTVTHYTMQMGSDEAMRMAEYMAEGAAYRLELATHDGAEDDVPVIEHDQAVIREVQGTLEALRRIR